MSRLTYIFSLPVQSTKRAIAIPAVVRVRVPVTLRQSDKVLFPSFPKVHISTVTH